MIQRREPPSLNEWLAAVPDLTKRGGRYEGPCPACGGTDRFTITPDHHRPPKIYCRSCEPSRSNPQAYRAILEAAGLAHDRHHHWQPRSTTPKPRLRPATTSSAKRPAIHFWDRAQPLADTPAEIYLIRRLAIPPQRDLLTRPENLRWLPRSASPYRLPSEAAGMIVANYQRYGRTAALELEALTAEGERLNWIGAERFRRTYGTKQGATFHVQHDGSDLVIAEGALTALAASVMHNMTAVAVGGTAGFVEIPATLLDRATLVDIDGDRAGVNTLEHLPRHLRIVQRDHGADALDVLQQQIVDGLMLPPEQRDRQLGKVQRGIVNPAAPALAQSWERLIANRLTPQRTGAKKSGVNTHAGHESAPLAPENPPKSTSNHPNSAIDPNDDGLAHGHDDLNGRPPADDWIPPF